MTRQIACYFIKCGVLGEGITAYALYLINSYNLIAQGGRRNQCRFQFEGELKNHEDWRFFEILVLKTNRCFLLYATFGEKGGHFFVKYLTPGNELNM